ncbi:MAG: hypothetical protein AAGJ81_13775 [Verrucomicrobiota bacterium]
MIRSTKYWAKLILLWAFRFISYVLIIIACGAFAGSAAFSLLGKLFMPSMTFGELAITGARVGAILAGVWASGVAIVLCFVKGKQERDAQALASK